jgi:hypothetical protein
MATTLRRCVTHRLEFHPQIRNIAASAPLTLMPIEPPEIPPATPGVPTIPPQENPPGSPRPEVPPPVHEPGEPPRPDELPGNHPEELPTRGPSGPTTPNPATDFGN